MLPLGMVSLLALAACRGSETPYQATEADRVACDAVGNAMKAEQLGTGALWSLVALAVPKVSDPAFKESLRAIMPWELSHSRAATAEQKELVRQRCDDAGRPLPKS
jgi:hypothetical protein